MSASNSSIDLHILKPSDSDGVDSDDLELTYPSDSELDLSPTSVNPVAPSGKSSILPLASRRAPRSTSNIPTPIPNPAKKARGRKVPMSNGEPIYDTSRDKSRKGVRTYTCHVDGCGKCFVRGEHLKRHIRSIHTEEKPWMCTHENCGRTFSRRDNLNQHLRVHKLWDGNA